METDSLYVLLGLPEHANIERLRSAYEGAVGTAAGRQDWARAKQLSAAFDRLPDSVRLTMYPGRDRNARRWDPAHPPRPSRTVRTTRTRRTGVRWRVVRATALGAALIVLVGVGAWKYLHTASHPAQESAPAGPTLLAPTSADPPATSPQTTPPRPAPTPFRARASTPVIRPTGDTKLGNTGHQIGGLPLWTTPPTVPLDSRGNATMRCAGPLGVTAWSKIDHRIAFTCPPGATPEYLAIP